MNADGFYALARRLATAWSEQNTEAAVDCFTPDAIYMEPPDIQIYQGHEQLRPYFAALGAGTYMRFDYLWFDEERQVGAGEYAFGVTGKPNADHGVVVMEIRNERIAVWREYQRRGPADLDDFLAIEGKEWEWHIGNYP